MTEQGPRFSEIALDRKLPLRDQIYDVIRRSIIIGELRPGQALNEVEIAKQLGVSRTPVREAVKRISDEGLIDVFAQHGTFVTRIGREAVEEAYIIRSALELESVRRAAGGMTSQHEEALEDVIAMHETAIVRRRFADAIRLDDQFHRHIAEINGLSMLWRAVDISKAQMDRGRYLRFPGPAGARLLSNSTARSFRPFMIAARSVAVEAMRRHLNTSLANILSLLDEEAA